MGSILKQHLKGEVRRFVEPSQPVYWVVSYYRRPVMWDRPVYEILESVNDGPGRVAELMCDPANCHAKYFSINEKRHGEIAAHIADKERRANMTADECWMDDFKKQIHEKQQRRNHARGITAAW